ncbi:MAG TPA: DUF1820 family protein [Gammaproteobacteria bacterium]|nr:DUF1820 family protein [Gammaproteobacteria bacterium]
MASKTLYRVVFVNQGKVYEIYARKIAQGAMFGFVEVEQIVFGERSSVVVDPSEERLKGEFADVKRTYIPMHSIVRIDEVARQGVAKITVVEGGSAATIPFPLYTPGGPGKR